MVSRVFLDTPSIIFLQRVFSMSRTQLHLVSSTGVSVSLDIRAAVESAFGWAVREFPYLDEAVVAGWAEEVASAMELKSEGVASPRRYAYAALHGKVRDWMKSGAARETSVGIGDALEGLGGVHGSFQGTVDRAILFEQLKATLNERDRYILVLLLQDNTSPATVASALGVSYAAAAKAIQRVKDRIAATLVGDADKNNPGRGSSQFCETKG